MGGHPREQTGRSEGWRGGHMCKEQQKSTAESLCPGNLAPEARPPCLAGVSYFRRCHFPLSRVLAKYKVFQFRVCFLAIFFKLIFGCAGSLLHRLFSSCGELGATL